MPAAITTWPGTGDAVQYQQLETQICLHCGGVVAFDRQREIAYHVRPTCEGFRKAMEAGQAKYGGLTVGTLHKRI